MGNEGIARYNNKRGSDLLGQPVLLRHSIGGEFKIGSLRDRLIIGGKPKPAYLLRIEA